MKGYYCLQPYFILWFAYMYLLLSLASFCILVLKNKRAYHSETLLRFIFFNIIAIYFASDHFDPMKI